ncbi:alpha/beta hydrolase [Euzebya rosea]|uniref:alpha/beta hydrolase n=1 Tax=Euzebya rosea TaxID=2052804 RepID=UPI000D3E3B5B|nr:alpha/beta hydrolase [Euzebya rosea]
MSEHTQPEHTQPEHTQPEATAIPRSGTSTDVTFPSGDLTLAGSLRHPDGPATGAAALLISGSGPLDRDSNTRKARLGVSALLADALADAGVLSLRYDKRGVGDSDGDYDSAGLRDNIDDAVAALSFLRSQEGVDPERVVVVGHSEGALIALDIAATHGEDVGGVALLAGTTHNGEEVLRWQATRVAEFLPTPVRLLLKLLRTDIAASQTKRLASIKASNKDVMRVQLVAKLNAKWLREFMAFEPAPLLERVSVPVLAVTGAGDVQVDPEDVEAMRQLVTAAPFEGHVVDGVNHILRAGDPSPTTYRTQTGNPLDARVVSHVTRWLARLPLSREAAEG